MMVTSHIGRTLLIVSISSVLSGCITYPVIKTHNSPSNDGHKVALLYREGAVYDQKPSNRQRSQTPRQQGDFIGSAYVVQVGDFDLREFPTRSFEYPYIELREGKHEIRLMPVRTAFSSGIFLGERSIPCTFTAKANRLYAIRIVIDKNGEWKGYCEETSLRWHWEEYTKLKRSKGYIVPSQISTYFKGRRDK